MKELNPQDLKIQFYHFPPPTAGSMSTGKLPAGCIVEHLPTGITTACDLYREPHRNKAQALRALANVVTP